jgi:hypothetical protein
LLLARRAVRTESSTTLVAAALPALLQLASKPQRL